MSLSHIDRTVSIQSITPSSLLESDFQALNELTQDMWGTERGLWELIRCSECWKISSKEQVFLSSKDIVTTKTVQQIMNGLDISVVHCPHCGHEASFIYGSEHIHKIRERLLESITSFITICRDTMSNEIVWFTDAYIAPIDVIYERELFSHYEKVWLNRIQSRIEEILWFVPEKMIVFSAMGFHPVYSHNMGLLFRMLREFFWSIPSEFHTIPWIAELDDYNNFWKISHLIGTKTLWVSHLATNTWEKYKSNLVVAETPIWLFLDWFNNSPKAFLRRTVWNKKKENPIH